MSQPFFSIIIPTRNRLSALNNCLQRLAAGNQFGMTLVEAGKTSGSIEHEASYEVIVSDDSQDTETQAWVETHFPFVRYSLGPQKGPAANRNNGAKQAHGHWLIFTDDDCLPEPDWLYNYLQQIPRARALEGAIRALSPITSDLQVCPVNESGGNFWSANIAIERNLFEELCGFDEFFPYAKLEDMDLKFRIEMITPIPFVKDAIVYHPVEKLTFLKSIKRDFRGIESHGYIMAKHPDAMHSRNLGEAILFKYKSYTRWAFQSLFKGHFRRFLSLTASLIGEIPLIIFYYVKHRKNTFPS